MSWWTAPALAVALALLAPARAAVFQPLEFDTPEQRDRYTALTRELRCLVCQNQSIAESNADLASDLRREVYRMLREGASDDQVVAFMVARYGDFVLYRPPFRATTVLLWVGPFVLAVAALGFLLRQVRRRRPPAAAAELSREEREQLARLLRPPGDDEVR